MPNKPTEFHEKQVRDDVKLNLPDSWKLRVFKVISGDSGKEYWVQYMKQSNRSENDVYTPLTIMLCDCPNGKFQQPLTVLGLKDFWCKHSKALYETFIKKEKS